MHASRHYAFFSLCLTFIAIFFVQILPERLHADDRAKLLDKKLEQIGRSLTVDGEFVHNVGRLQMNVTNWGFVGSLPKSRYPMSESPSAQWPSGSGVEYLYAGGIQVGAMVNGVPVVSTGYPETEFYPPKGTIHTIYRSCEGSPRGNHYPDNPDDDFDGRSDEDWLNGMDDDGFERVVGKFVVI